MENENQKHEENIPEKKPGFLKETFRTIVITLAIVLPIRYFIAQPFIVSGASMDPTFANGQYLIVDQISYRFEEPKRDDVIIFKYPNDTSKYYIKRIIGLPGETIEIKGTTVTIHKGDKSFDLIEPYIQNNIPGNFLTTLKDDEYFVLGDNRPASSDSRYWGPLNRKYIIGRPFVRLLPFEKIDMFPGRI
ncbi:MAG: signal peptidase I [Candidatus Taylorbacteria bacterium RIFCSPHIGHO2_01_FULL_45_63]|uniref:Signal peptidase I n=1 Tax=Candidatus Taylorbacteria bacterium RIFCSPHIGHO2_02_FULL_45_35 TaxID=1802311 RepID=A0A1G2MQB3_9BACT|nr:MAG: signal peptidase I [Candidatus Taylorbacteria bacterium RIFCSPHIGHO2_01_FULL_45_63]OHA26043.1 MAG: signal peptidase I [Candidatus Taylorbacteria bacterium RIFCSPHIGHO2_02_FULL_45_35]OHA32472.1 MAG: signal peptidase I [Candidatus Taylorbacteria bacterium RIFCSPLOWO2_01_FULL_45_34b]